MDDPTAHWDKNPSCTHGYSVKSAKRGVRANLRKPKANKARASHFVVCTRSEASERAVRAHRDRLLRWRRIHKWELAYRRYVAHLPYACDVGRWAVPCYIVECESQPDYSWGSYNASGAAGPYQIMPEWGRPWPISTYRDKLAHHRLAAMIWAGGSGAGNWVCA